MRHRTAPGGALRAGVDGPAAGREARRGLFIPELTGGHRDDRGAGRLIKVAGSFHGLDAHARWTMAAAAEAHHATGAPIAVHLELGTGRAGRGGPALRGVGVPGERVILGHLNRSPDPVVHRQAAASGCWLAFDGPSRASSRDRLADAGGGAGPGGGGVRGPAAARRGTR
ncbi:hypothetical protein LT493_11130 [Streptomyces tricolor]|nr:hypothetical protein [Streptomyces tricolor]